MRKPSQPRWQQIRKRGNLLNCVGNKSAMEKTFPTWLRRFPQWKNNISTALAEKYLMVTVIKNFYFR
jgi:hypothetical protein